MKVLSAVVCAVLLAINVVGDTTSTISDNGVASEPEPVNVKAGDYYAFSIVAIAQTIVKCRLTNPDGDILDFTPGVASSHGNRYELRPISEGAVRECSVLVRDLHASDNGIWQIAFVTPSGGNSRSIQLFVAGAETQESIGINENAEWLTAIEYPARKDQTIDISLPRIEFEEECYILTPEKRVIRASEANIEGVNVHEITYFVSCRMTIDSMVEDLLGDWAICGKYTKNTEKRERCQPVKIYWNPQTDWHISNIPMYEHPVHFGATLSPTVTGIGQVVSCHVVTPNGEDLVIQDFMYPSIKVTRADSTCTFSIGPIYTQSLLGDWEIYGIFSNSVEGLNESRFPFRMFLYDAENPLNQAYNRTVLDPVIRPVDLGNILNMEVGVKEGLTDRCDIESPPGSAYDLEEINERVACRVTIGPITEKELGDWKIIGKFSNNGTFIERQQTLHIVLEDPENPIEDRIIIDLPAQTVNIEMGQKDPIVIPSHELIKGESCHIRMPSGQQYQIMQGFTDVNGIEVIEGHAVECGVTVTGSKDVLGDWTLIARATQHSELIERRLNFTIYASESVEALRNAVNLTEGDDLHVSLKNPTLYHDTCKLIGPYGFECQAAVRDPERLEYCGFIRRNVQSFNTGTWTITFGERNNFKAEIGVTVNAEDAVISTTPEPTVISTLNVVRDRSVNQVVGPENSVYCRLEDPQGLVVFDDFGRCRLALDKVGLEHHGTWKMLIAAPGKILTEEHQLTVNVKESDSKAVVSTSVTKAKPNVTITCSVQSDAAVIGCKFRNPQGKILIANSGLSEDRYKFYGNGSSYDSGVWSHECGILVTDPVTTDLGLWRCALETTADTYYGHMRVLCPWALSDPAIAATVQQEPILNATRPLVSVVEEEPVTMSCSVEAAIRYCYFRAANGTIFTVSPGMASPSMEYAGAGFDAGECGLRFQGLHAADSGRWSCHVGLMGVADEQRALFQVTVLERMSVRHFNGHGNVMTVEGIVHGGRALDYCRFVRIDGLGFTMDNMPTQYIATGILEDGQCQFITFNATILDLHPWTVVARIRGQQVEIAKDTMESVIIGPPDSGTGPEDKPQVIYRNNGFGFFVYVFITLMLVFIILGGLLGPRRNREWTSQRAATFRRSFSSTYKSNQQNPTPTYSP